MRTRREALKVGLIGSLAVFGVGDARGDGGDNPSPRTTPFAASLPVPPILTRIDPNSSPANQARADSIYAQALSEHHDRYVSRTIPSRSGVVQPLPPPPTDSSCDYFEVNVEQRLQSVLPGAQTTVYAYVDAVTGQGGWPGPTLDIRRNRVSVIRFNNNVPEPLVVHYHGAHTPPDSDSYPCDGIPTGGSRVYIFPNDNESPATLWYHDHMLHLTAEHVYKGLAAFALLRPNPDLAGDQDAVQVDSALPNGKYDIPLVLQDRLFNADNSFNYPAFNHDGVLGDVFLVNGAVQPALAVENRKYRFRFLNGSNARVYELFLSTGDLFTQIGSDGGLLKSRVDRKSIHLAPAERKEVVIDFTKLQGQRVVLIDYLEQGDGRKPDGLNFQDPKQIMCFDVHSGAGDPSTIPVVLNSLLAGATAESKAFLDEFVPAKAAVQRQFQFDRSHGAWVINGQAFECGRADAVIKLNTSEIWTLVNGSGGWAHPIHLHDEEFIILDRNGIPPSKYDPGEAGLKDVFYLGPNDTVRVIAKYTGPNNVGDYVFHCHNLEHEDMDMMGTFRIVS